MLLRDTAFPVELPLVLLKHHNTPNGVVPLAAKHYRYHNAEPLLLQSCHSTPNGAASLQAMGPHLSLPSTAAPPLQSYCCCRLAVLAATELPPTLRSTTARPMRSRRYCDIAASLPWSGISPVCTPKPLQMEPPLLMLQPCCSHYRAAALFTTKHFVLLQTEQPMLLLQPCCLHYSRTMTGVCL